MPEDTGIQQSDSAPEAASPDAPVSDQVAATEPQGPGWLNAFLAPFGRGRAAANTPGALDAEGGEQEDGDGEPAAHDQTSAEESTAESPSPEGQPFRVFQTEAEYQAEVARQAQSLKDRELARERQRQQAERLKQLRQDDPVGFAEETERLEAQQRQIEDQSRQISEWQRSTMQLADRHILDPFVLALPEPIRDKLCPNGQGPAGLEGRQKLVEDGIAALAEHHRKEGAREQEQRFRSDPKYRQRLWKEFADTESRDEPEIAAGGPTSRGPTSDGQHFNEGLRRWAGISVR